jgi:hypothetical protein
VPKITLNFSGMVKVKKLPGTVTSDMTLSKELLIQRVLKFTLNFSGMVKVKTYQAQ